MSDINLFVSDFIKQGVLKTPRIIEAFEKIIGTPVGKIAQQCAMGFFGCQVLEMAVKNVGSLDRKALRDMLFKMEAETIGGPHKVAPLESDDSGMQVAYMSNIVQWQKKKPGSESNPYKAIVGGYEREIVWPWRYKTADPLYPFPGWER